MTITHKALLPPTRLHLTKVPHSLLEQPYQPGPSVQTQKSLGGILYLNHTRNLPRFKKKKSPRPSRVSPAGPLELYGLLSCWAHHLLMFSYTYRRGFLMMATGHRSPSVPGSSAKSQNTIELKTNELFLGGWVEAERIDF